MLSVVGFRDLRILCLIILLCLCHTATAQPVLFRDLKEKKKEHKDDRVVLDNGDTLTGEIKKVEFGILYFKSDRAIGTLELDWERIQSIRSSARFEFETSDGNIYIGTIDAEEVPGSLKLRLDTGETLPIRIDEILGIHEMQQSFLGRLSLTLDAGITYTKGNNQTQINVGSTLRYARPRYSLQMNANSIFSGQKGGANTSRHEFNFFGKRDLSLMWDYIAVMSLLHDNQQDLDLRATLGGGFERTFRKTNRTLFAGIMGFAYTRENYVPEKNADRNNVEVLTGISLSTYKFRSSETTAYVLVFPSVTDPGRLRIDTNAYWQWEIVKDLFWKVSAFDNFDNRPPTGSSKNNFGLTTSFGWSF